LQTAGREKPILFVGDSISGIFPTWERDMVKIRELIHTIEGIDVKYCLGGHWVLSEKKELLAALEEGTV
jgi:hypothetical protein